MIKEERLNLSKNKRKQRIVLPIGDNFIVAEAAQHEDFPSEICVYIEDTRGNIVQDICSVSERAIWMKKLNHYIFDPTCVDCKVWGNENDDDFTEEFSITIYNEEE